MPSSQCQCQCQCRCQCQPAITVCTRGGCPRAEPRGVCVPEHVVRVLVGDEDALTVQREPAYVSLQMATCATTSCFAYHATLCSAVHSAPPRLARPIDLSDLSAPVRHYQYYHLLPVLSLLLLATTAHYYCLPVRVHKRGALLRYHSAVGAAGRRGVARAVHE